MTTLLDMNIPFTSHSWFLGDKLEFVKFIISIVTIIITFGGLLLVIYQLKHFQITLKKGVIDSLYERGHDINRILIEFPELYKIMHNLECNTIEELSKPEVAALSETVLDFYELIYMQDSFLDKPLYESWKIYIYQSYQKTPILKEYLKQNIDSYTVEMVSYLNS